ncbi:hypothetical protein ACP4OV_010766 [Aristida adscensionis]
MAAAGSSSRFALLCDLLRRYMQENPHQRQQKQAALAGVFAPPASATQEAEDGDDGRTMQLLPARAAGASPPSLTMQGPAAAEGQLKAAGTTLTIMYGGRVVAFADFPADKAEELMEMAGLVSAQAPENEELALKLATPGAAVPQPEPEEEENDEETLVDLPIARKLSLQRFLRKRKHRGDDDDDNDDPYRKAPAYRGAGGSGSGSGGCWCWRGDDDEPGPSSLGGSWLRL